MNNGNSGSVQTQPKLIRYMGFDNEGYVTIHYYDREKFNAFAARLEDILKNYADIKTRPISFNKTILIYVPKEKQDLIQQEIIPFFKNESPEQNIQHEFTDWTSKLEIFEEPKGKITWGFTPQMVRRHRLPETEAKKASNLEPDEDETDIADPSQSQQSEYGKAPKVTTFYISRAEPYGQPKDRNPKNPYAKPRYNPKDNSWGNGGEPKPRV